MRFWLLVFLVTASGGLWAEDADPFGPLRHLEGRWEGSIDGRLGTGKGIREYEFIIDGKFLIYHHASVRLPQEKSPEGDHHKELAIFSFDTDRGKIVLREFMNEGIVLRSPCDFENSRLQCVAEDVESGAGIRARLSIEFESPHLFHETYELAFPKDEELQQYFTNRWTRVPVIHQ